MGKMGEESSIFFFNIYFYLAVLGLSFSMWGSSSVTRDRTWVPCIGSAES